MTGRRASGWPGLCAVWMYFAIVAVSGCASSKVGTTATSFLNRVRESPDPNIRHIAYARLADPGCYIAPEQQQEAAQVLASKLDEKREPLATRAVICRTLGEIGRPEARPALLRSCDDPEPSIRAAACRALGKIGQSEDALVLARVMAADSDSDCRIAAIEGLGEMRTNDPRIQQVLIDCMEHPDPAMRLAAYVSLQKTTGTDHGPSAEAWRKALGSAPEAPSVATQPADTQGR